VQDNLWFSRRHGYQTRKFVRTKWFDRFISLRKKPGSYTVIQPQDCSRSGVRRRPRQLQDKVSDSDIARMPRWPFSRPFHLLSMYVESLQSMYVDWTIETGCYRGIYLVYLLPDAHDPLAPAMAQRVTLRKRNPYNTRSNLRRVIKTPGGQLVYHHLKKRGTAPKCGDCGIALPGVCSWV